MPIFILKTIVVTLSVIACILILSTVKLNDINIKVNILHDWNSYKELTIRNH